MERQKLLSVWLSGVVELVMGLRWGGVTGLLLMVCLGCAPVISKSVLESSSPDISFASLKKETEKYLGKTVVLGGSVISVRHLEEGSVLEVLERPLGYRLMPQLGDRTGGRFLVRFKGIVEDHLLEHHRMVTVAGKVSGTEVLPLDQTTYQYPVLDVVEMRIWESYGRDPSASPRFFLNFGVSGSH